MIAGVDAGNRILAALGHPGRAIRPHDDAVRSRSDSQRNEIDLARGWIEAAELAVTLGRIPDDAVLADGDVVRMATSRGQGIRLRGDLRLRARGASQKERQDEEDEMHTETAHIVLLELGQTVTGLYTGVRHSGNRWSIPRTTFM